jgi:hypothetical protein
MLLPRHGLRCYEALLGVRVVVSERAKLDS